MSDRPPRYFAPAMDSSAIMPPSAVPDTPEPWPMMNPPHLSIVEEAVAPQAAAYSIPGSPSASGQPAPAEPVPARPYFYDDGTIILHVGGREYKIGRSYLTRRSPWFRSRQSELPLTAQHEVWTEHLNNEPSEFEPFLWAVHAAPDESDVFAKLSDSESKAIKLLNIGSVCHQYECVSLGEWAMRTVLDVLERRGFYFGAELVRKLVLTATRWQGGYRTRMREILRLAMESNKADFMAVVLAADELAPPDTFLLAYAYYYLLKTGSGFRTRTWDSDARVRDVDRRRLVCGFFALTTHWQELCTNDQMARSTYQLPPSALIDKAETTGAARGYSGYGTDYLRATEIRERLWSYFDLAPWHL